MREFEDQLEKLETIVAEMESGKLSLEETLQRFEAGMKLSELCQKELARADGRIQAVMDARKATLKEIEVSEDEDEEE